MRIGFFTDTYLPVVHGVEISTESFRKNLEKAGHQVFIYAPSAPGYRDKSKKIFRLKSVRVIEKPEMRLAFPLAERGKMKDLVDFKLDIAHAQTPFSLGFFGKFVSARQKIPFIYTHHTDYAEYSKAYFKGKRILPALARLWTAKFCGLADAVIAPSRKIEKMLRNYGVKKPIRVVPTGINLKAFEKNRAAEKSAKILRKKLGIGEKENVLIFVGRIGKEKNVAFLIKAFQEISKKRGGVKFIVVGDGPFLARYKSLAKKLKLGNIIFTGAVPHKNLPVYYRAADLFVFASLTETQGIVILEAMASGLPVAVLKDEAFEDAVIEGKNGFAVKSKSPKVFAGKALEILENKSLREKFSRASLKIAEDFSEEKQAGKLLEVYKKVLKSAE